MKTAVFPKQKCFIGVILLSYQAYSVFFFHFQEIIFWLKFEKMSAKKIVQNLIRSWFNKNTFIKIFEEHFWKTKWSGQITNKSSGISHGQDLNVNSLSRICYPQQINGYCECAGVCVTKRSSMTTKMLLNILSTSVNRIVCRYYILNRG